MDKISLSALTKYFSEEKDVYVQNVSNGIVSLAFGEKEEVGYSVPFAPDPVCITSIVPFDLVKKSITFRKSLLRMPTPFLRLLTEEEYQAYFKQKSARIHKPAEELIEETERKQLNLQEKAVDPAQERPDPVTTSSTEPETMDEVLTPRVMQIVNNLNQPVEDGSKIVLSDVIDELSRMKLNLDDLEYLRSQGRFRTVKKWAQDRLKDIEDDTALTAEEIEQKVNPEISTMP